MNVVVCVAHVFHCEHKSVNTWVLVLWWSMCVWCVVCLYKLCVRAMCVCGSCVCARVWWWYAFGVVSGCLCVCSCFVWLCGHLFLCSLVLVFMVCVSVCCCLPQHCVVLWHSTTDRHTHHVHEHHTAHENTYKPHDSRFQNETDIRWIKGERTPSIFIYSTTLMWAVMITSRFALQIQVLFSEVCN